MRCISTDGHANRDVGSLAVTNVVTAVRSADEAKARPTSAARLDVADEVVAQLIHLNIESCASWFSIFNARSPLIIELIEASAPDDLTSQQFLPFARGTFPHTRARWRAGR